MEDLQELQQPFDAVSHAQRRELFCQPLPRLSDELQSLARPREQQANIAKLGEIEEAGPQALGLEVDRHRLDASAGSIHFIAPDMGQIRAQENHLARFDGMEAITNRALTCSANHVADLYLGMKVPVTARIRLVDLDQPQRFIDAGRAAKNGNLGP